MCLPALTPSCLHPHSRHCQPKPLQETASTLTGRSGSSLLWGHCSIYWSWYAQVLFVPSKSLCFPQSFERSSESFPGILIPLLDPQVGKSGAMPRTFILLQEHLVLLFSHLWVAHLAGMGFDFNMIAPSYCLVVSPLSLDGVSFLAMAVIWVFSQESMRHGFFYPAILVTM